MIYITVFELIYAVLYVVEKPDVFTKSSAFLIFVNRKKSYFPSFFSTLLDLLFVGCFGISMALLAIHFIYRYLAVKNHHLLESFQNWKLILWLSFPILNGAVWMFAGGVIFKANEDSHRFIRAHYEVLTRSNDTKLDDLYYMGPFYYPVDENGNAYVNWRAFGGSAILLTLIGLSFFTMFFFGYKCYNVMRQLIPEDAESEKFQSIQSQLFRALVFQTLIPVFLLHIPASVIYATIFFNCSTEIVGQILALTVAMYPALNPLPTIFIIKNYRNALKDFLFCQSRVHSEQSGVTSTRASTVPQADSTRMQTPSRF